jgi:hypothetical protein
LSTSFPFLSLEEFGLRLVGEVEELHKVLAFRKEALEDVPGEAASPDSGSDSS